MIYVDAVLVLVVLYAVVTDIRWFNRDLFPQWWNPFKW